MAVGDYANLQQYQSQVRTGVFEKVYQNFGAYNDATNGAIQFLVDRVEGDYRREEFFPKISGAIRHRSINSQSAVTPLIVSSNQKTSVKVSKAWGPLDWQRDEFERALLQPAQDDYQTVYRMLGQQMGEDMSVEIFNTAIGAVASALVTNASNFYTVGSSGPITTSSLFSGMRLLGDHQADIKLWVMPGKLYADLASSQASIAAENLVAYTYFQGIPATMNKPVIIADVPGLEVTSGSPVVTDQYCLGLTTGALTIRSQGNEFMAIEPVLGNQNVQWRTQGEYDYTLGLKGFTWDETNGGTNPTATALSTGTNWDIVAASAKGLSGVVIKARV